MSIRYTSSPHPTSPPTHAFTPRPRKRSTLDSLTLYPRKYKESRDLKRKATEVQEVERIMDPSYLSPRASTTIGYGHGRTIGMAAEFGPNYDYGYGHGYGHGNERSRTTSSGGAWGEWHNDRHYGVDAAGHLHDIDHRPFPVIPPRRGQSLMATEGYSAQASEDGRHPTRRSPRTTRRATSPPAYWETFHTTQVTHASESESSDVEATPVSRIPCTSAQYNFPPPAATYAYTQPDQNYLSRHSYFDNTTHYAIGDGSGEPVLRTDGWTGKRVSNKSKPRGSKEKDNLKYNDGEDQDDISDEGEDGSTTQKNKTRTVAGEGPKTSMSPKQRLHNTWVATRFDVHLKVIRTQRWLREHV